jgi:MFS transporter, DHA1 family, multidrug resistance protein
MEKQDAENVLKGVHQSDQRTLHRSRTNDTNTVDWDGLSDPLMPYNWPLRKKLLVTLASVVFVFVISFSSSAFAPARYEAGDQFGTSEVVMSLGVGLFILGFGIGPLFFAPLSEVVGHMAPLAIGLVGCGLLQIPFALAPDVPVLLVARFLQGALGSAVLSVGTGMFAEVYEPVQRGVAVSASACSMNMASAIAPIACSGIVERHGWRWIGWTTMIMAAFIGLSGPFVLHETSPRIILLRKARRLRKSSGNEGLKTKYADDKVDFAILLQKYLLRPLKIFWTEPILVILTIYLTFVYGTLYLSYQMFPISFRQRGWLPVSSNLPFAAVALGILAAWVLFSIFTLTWYRQKRTRQGSTPEDRLPPMILGGAMLPGALLWFGWSENVHWMSQACACFFVGMSLQLIFMAGVVYIVDVYGANSNCAMSIQVVFRSLAAASFPLWSPPMYRSLGVPWSATLLACVAALLLPFPLLFMRFGPRVRHSSKYTASSP